MDTKTKDIIKVTEVDFTDQAKPFILMEVEYSSLEEEIQALVAKKDALRTKILNKFEETFGHQGQSIKSNLTGHTLSRVISVYQTIDEDGVKKAITPDVWNRITSRKIERDLFFAALKMGEIVPREVAPYIEDKEVDKLVVRVSKKGTK